MNDYFKDDKYMKELGLEKSQSAKKGPKKKRRKLPSLRKNSMLKKVGGMHDRTTDPFGFSPKGKSDNSFGFGSERKGNFRI